MKLGNHFDKVYARLEREIAKMQAGEKKLIKQGCLQGYIHFKTDGRTMFLLSPVDSSGKRGYTHVGVNPDKQAAACAAVEREAERVALERRRGHLSGVLRELGNNMRYLLDEAQGVLDHFTEEA